MGIEQRFFERASASFEIMCRRAGSLWYIWRGVAVTDFSAGGRGFDAEELFEEGEPLDIQIRLPSARASLLLRARVVRCRPLPSKACRCAVEFIEMTSDQQAEIDGLVQFLRTPPASS